MKNDAMRGHGAALVTVLIWGTTFISTKVLLERFAPVEILLMRFVLGLIALMLVCPRGLGWTGWRRERVFAAAGLCGICLYYLLENIALTCTMASNVGIVISTAPFFTAILSRLFLREERLGAGFFLGFVLAMAGIGLISFNGARLSLNPIGDLLALLAALVWACYSVLTRKIGGFGFDTVLTTRRIFFYGILCMLPAFFLSKGRWELAGLADPVCLANLLFLGLGASAMCFVTWNLAVKELGAVKTSVYIYMVPVITVAASALILGEPVTVLTGMGTALTLAGLLISERKRRG